MKSTKKETVLITGGAGFIGHAIVEHLLETTDFDIISLDRLDTSGCLDRLHDVFEKNPQWRKRTQVVWHDLKAPLSTHVIHKLGEVNYILHLAAGSHVNRSIKYPLEFVMDNVVGTCNLLNYAIAECESLKLFLYFSTDEVFGPAPAGVTFKEDDRYNARNPYAATKAAAEELCNAYANTYGLPAIVTHTMNAYGPRQHLEKFIPIVIKKLQNDETITIHSDKSGTKSSSRRYLFSRDVAEAVRFLMFTHTAGEKYNVCADIETDNLTLAKMIAEIMGKELKFKLEYPEDSRPGNDFRYSVCGDKLNEMGWKQRVNLREGLEETIRWYLDNPTWGDS
ncbi:NAD-dependent epimerase [Candidatus Pacearchaeota archaeon]|jgi:dTDP-glucose 4,6-dehydratase|nr:NAD-dependent epimerase [Candidatus Pacearchaeota archaeon]|tara:strand:+ start:11323 stop:12333 length:1011 start_codon:yes stop_codon:yes gene_type:complete